MVPVVPAVMPAAAKAETDAEARLIGIAPTRSPIAGADVSVGRLAVDDARSSIIVAGRIASTAAQIAAAGPTAFALPPHAAPGAGTVEHPDLRTGRHGIDDRIVRTWTAAEVEVGGNDSRRRSARRQQQDAPR